MNCSGAREWPVVRGTEPIERRGEHGCDLRGCDLLGRLQLLARSTGSTGSSTCLARHLIAGESLGFAGGLWSLTGSGSVGTKRACSNSIAALAGMSAGSAAALGSGMLSAGTLTPSSGRARARRRPKRRVKKPRRRSVVVRF